MSNRHQHHCGSMRYHGPHDGCPGTGLADAWRASGKLRCEATTSSGAQCQRETHHPGFHRVGDERSAQGALVWGDIGPEFIDRIKRVVRRSRYKN